MKLKKYLALTRAGIIEALQFRLGSFVIVVGNLLYLIVVYFLWKAIYASAGTDVVNGMTFSDTLIYLVLATALFNFMEMYAVWEIGRAIQSGKIVLDLLKPMKYRTYLFWSYSGSFVTNFFMTFLPTFIVVAAVTHGAVHLGLNLLWFVVSVVMAIIINYSIDFIVGTVCLYTESIWGNKHHEAGDSPSAFGSHHPPCILPRGLPQGSGVPALPVHIQCAPFHTA